MAKPRTCNHIFGNGNQCGSPALLNDNYCYYHVRYKRKDDPSKPNYDMPDLEDGDSVQLLINETLRGLITGNLDHKKAAIILYGAQIASNNVKRWEVVEEIEDEEENAREPKEEKEPIMVKILREALTDLKVRGGPDDGKPADEVFARKMKEVADTNNENNSN